MTCADARDASGRFAKRLPRPDASLLDRLGAQSPRDPLDQRDIDSLRTVAEYMRKDQRKFIAELGRLIEKDDATGVAMTGLAAFLAHVTGWW